MGNGEKIINLGMLDDASYPGRVFESKLTNKEDIDIIYNAILENDNQVFLRTKFRVDNGEVTEIIFARIQNVVALDSGEGIKCTFQALLLLNNDEYEKLAEGKSDIAILAENASNDDMDDKECDAECSGDCMMHDDITADDLDDYLENIGALFGEKDDSSDNKDSYYQKYKKEHGGNSAISKYINFVDNLDASNEVKNAICDEIHRLSNEKPQSSDYNVCINWLETAMALPWNVPYSENFSLENATEIINKSHYGMKEVKDRIIELLAVRKKNNDNTGAIICLVGPPGVGKTSIARSIADALGKKFTRFSIGGVHDETDIVGHRRTYVGARPGKLISLLSNIHAKDPVMLIDEIDKAPSGASQNALLEVLDPEQNKNFTDVYLDFPFDLSKIVFVVTANDIADLPHPLLDRMEIIQIPGYTENEKVHIATDYLIPRQLKKNGLSDNELAFEEDAIKSVISGYTGEAGVRNLERSISKVVRKFVRSEMSEQKIIDGNVVKPENLEKFLGVPCFDNSTIIKANTPGTCLGLSVSGLGIGDVLRIEVQNVPGKGNIVLTGKLGDVIKESATVAFTWLKKYFAKDKNYKNFFEKNDFHLHIPEGAIGKDGPSAGVAFGIAFYSLYTGKPIKDHLAMTGEINLLGEITAIGGLKEKILGAKRNKVVDIIIPKQNNKDLQDIDKEILDGVRIHPVSRIEEAILIAFDKKISAKKVTPEVNECRI